MMHSKTLCGKFLSLFFVLVTIFLTSCATKPISVELNPIQTDLELDASGMQVLIDILDRRDPSLDYKVGHVKSGRKVFDVTSEKDPVKWLYLCIAKELQRFKAQVFEDSKDLTQEPVVLYIELLECYVQASRSYGATVALEVAAQKGGTTVFKGTLKGETVPGINWTSSSSRLQEALEIAMRSLLEKLLPQVVDSGK